MTALGYSNPGKVVGEALVVTDFADLEAKKDQVNGKIVVYNEKFCNYSYSGDIRVNGMSRACNLYIIIFIIMLINFNFNENIFLAKYGATAVLIRSVTPYSIETVHTGY